MFNVSDKAFSNISEAYHNTFSLEIANEVPYLHKSKFATCIRRMLRLACRKLRKIYGFSTRHVENSFRRVVTQP